MSDKSKLWDLKDTKFTDWLIALPISLVLVMVASIILRIYSRIDATSSGGIFLTIILTFLIVTTLKERREQGSSSYQKITVGVIIFLVILDAILVTVFFINPPAMGKEAIALAEMEEEYYNISLYYAQELKDLDAVQISMEQNLAEQKYPETLEDIKEYERLKTKVSDSLALLCERAEEKAINLEESNNLADLYVFCKNRELIRTCLSAEVFAMNQMVYFFQNIQTKTKTECFEVLNNLKGSYECNNFNKEMNQEVEDDFLQWEQLCNQLPQ